MAAPGSAAGTLPSTASALRVESVTPTSVTTATASSAAMTILKRIVRLLRSPGYKPPAFAPQHRRRPDGSRSSGMNRADQEPPADPRGLGLGPAGHGLGPAPQPSVRSSLIF